MKLWKSPITADSITKEMVRFGDLAVDGDKLYFLEGRSSGRSVVMLYQNGQLNEASPENLDIRTRIYEYGGGDFAASKGKIFASEKATQQLHLIENGVSKQLTTHPQRRYAGGVFHEGLQKLFCVCEQVQEGSEPESFLATVDLTGQVEKIHTGHDFYASIAIHGNKIAFLTWDHPDMPWDATKLHLATVSGDGKLVDAKVVAGGVKETIFQPQFSLEGELYFISDRHSGFSNLYRYRESRVEHLHPMAADFGWPQWVFNLSRYAFLEDDLLACIYCDEGLDRLALLHCKTKKFEKLELPFTTISGIRSSGKKLYFQGGQPDLPTAIIELDPKTRASKVIKSSFESALEKSWISQAQKMKIETESGLPVYGFYYPATNPKEVKTSPSPLIIRVHGGPTAQATAPLNMDIQYFTSRGFAFLDLNYRGSSGFGRAYREALYGNWGTADVEDAVLFAQHLVKQGLADPKRLIIKGGSAGGYTVLRALTLSDLFAVGVSYFGISDLKELTEQTHKFELHYNTHLIGGESEALYQKLSPIYHVDKIKTPLLLFQGGKDLVVPPSQSERMLKALEENGIEVLYELFPEEGHGFRSAEVIKKCLETELTTYKRILKLEI